MGLFPEKVYGAGRKAVTGFESAGREFGEGRFGGMGSVAFRGRGQAFGRVIGVEVLDVLKILFYDNME